MLVMIAYMLSLLFDGLQMISQDILSPAHISMPASLSLLHVRPKAIPFPSSYSSLLSVIIRLKNLEFLFSSRIKQVAALLL